MLQVEGTLSLEGGSLEAMSASEPSIVNHLVIRNATLTGAATVEISGLLEWGGSGIMSGSGTTTVRSGAVGALEGQPTSLSERTLLNKGEITAPTSGSELEMAEGAVIENKGTFIVNAEAHKHGAAIYAGGGSSPKIVNTGTFEKKISAFPDFQTKIGVELENTGTVETTAGAGGALTFTAGGSSSGGIWKGATFPSGSFSFTNDSLVGTIEAEGASVTAQGLTASTGTLVVRAGSTFTVPSGKTDSVHGLRLEGASVTGAGTLEIGGELEWRTLGTMSGTGATVVQTGATGQLEGHPMSLTERRLVNEGQLTAPHSGSEMEMSEGAVLENKGKFIANSEEEASGASIFKGSGASLFINAGIVEKTVATFPNFETKIGVDFKNYGQLGPNTGSLTIQHPLKDKADERAGHESKCADPVNCATGDYSEAQADLSIGGRGVGLDLIRTYDAQAAAAAGSAGAFGYGWSNSFSDHLVVEEEGKEVRLAQGDGGGVPFTESGKGAYTAPGWSQDTLNGSAEAGYTLTLPDQTEYAFSGSGRLESVTDRNGNETSLGYETGRLKTITDPAGRQITLTYNGEGLVESAEDPMGHLVEYAYEGGELASVTMPGEESPRWQFKYDGSHRMTSMTDGRGGKTTNEYDGSNRVISQADPAKRTITFEYGAFHTTITNEATGSVTDEWFTSNNQPYEITRGFGTLIEGRSNSSELCRANGSDSMLRKTSIALRTALSPSHGVAPCAAVPADLEPQRQHALGLDPDVQVGRLAGDREVADEAAVDQVVAAALGLLLGLLVADDPEPHPHPRPGRASPPATTSIAASAPFMS